MSESPSVRMGSAGARRVVIAAGAVWCAVLWGLVFTSSNPVVVNRAQVLASDIIAVGRRDPNRPGDLLVEKVWNGHQPAERLTVRSWPTLCPRGTIVVPLQFERDRGYRITQGELPNPPLDHQLPPDAAMVQPLVYPANDDVFRQLTDLVGPMAER